MRTWPWTGKVIAGCKSPAPLMTRWRLASTPWFQIKLHCFHRSDEDREVHDHPWLFVSLILWGGYDEVRPVKWVRENLRLIDAANALRRRSQPRIQGPDCADRHLERRRYGPGSILIRPAWWAHRVELLGRRSVSLVIVFPKVREWGFHTANGWIDWRTFHGQAGCGEDFPEYGKPFTEATYG